MNNTLNLQGNNGKDKSSEYLIQLIKKEVDNILNQKITHYKGRIKYFLYGLFILILILIVAGLIGKADLIRTLHNKAFPPETASHIAISYESLLELRGNDPRLQSRSIAFYARPNQRVKVYANLVHRFSGIGEKRKVFISVDGNLISKNPLTDFHGGFQDITNNMSFLPDFNREENIHQLVFALDDSQPEELTDEISIICVIIVCGSTI